VADSVHAGYSLDWVSKWHADHDPSQPGKKWETRRMQDAPAQSRSDHLGAIPILGRARQHGKKNDQEKDRNRNR
jgi:hypothetical protein